MGFLGGIVKKLIKLILYSGLVVAFIVLIPNLPPYTKFTSIELEPTQPRVGPLAPNDVLNNAQALYKDKLLGPEAFQIWNGEIYTGLATGEIVKVSPGGHVTFVTKIGQPCAGIIQEHICGRPLGFVIDEKNKLLYVADAYLGIWKVDLATDKKQLLVSPRVPIDGRIPKIFNSVALDKNGDLYWSDSSSDFYLRDGVLAALVDPSGRLFHYNSAKNSSKVLLDDIWFANGVLLSPDNQFVLVAESSRYRILKYYINGPKKGTSEVFVAGLPGLPDVLRALPDGSGVLASLYLAFDEDSPLLSRTMSNAPLARKLIARLIRLIEIPFEFLQSQFPNHIFESIVYQIGHFASIASFTPEKTGLVQMDWNGNIVASYFNTDGSLLHISDAIVYNNKLYTGCPHLQNFIGAVPAPPQLIKAFTANKPSAKEQPKVESNKPKVDENKEAPKNAKPVTRPTPQPTTTPKPTTKSNDIPKEKVVKQNTDPKESEKAKLKEADIKQKEVKKDEKPKAVPKQSDQKSKVAPNVADVKPKEPKVSASQAEAKPKVAQKDADPKLKATPQNTAQPKPDTKSQESQKKPVKETENKAKVSETNDVKSEPIKKEAHSKTGAEPGAKAATKLPEKSDKQNAKIKPASDPKLKKTETGKKTNPEAIPIKENIPSDTAKPNKETLKVIKKSGPQEIPNPAL
ncbi:adipocyte plasma membrane-associated protein-like isoform X2 [Maniola jurtina]|uniref:adipocyte plasma membrane-associated protein-like isoform X2 n=1 Tax=Maniola jurtina TaxID=191418 RepID=UPI001E6862BE|nr:adipocyte plasma membrane-associated protein-like isoform X2 [Maniola jurtina]